MTPSGIELVTFWLVVQFLKQLCNRMPQSIMVTLLFLIYINDLPNVTIHTNLSDNPKAILFTDDTSVIVNVNDWFSSHLLSLNFGKTHFMKFIAKIALVM